MKQKKKKKIAEVKSEAKKEEIKKEQNDTKNLLASYKNTEPSVIENEQKIEPFYSSKIEQKTELRPQNFEVKIDQNKSTEIEKKEKIKSEDTKVESAKKAEILTTKKIEKTKYEEKNIKKDSFEAVPFTPNASIKGRAKLVIIIDDVATFEHASMIKSLGLKITPSIFPATKTHPDTPNIARTFEFYMIHLPMQAKHFDSPEIGTLTINESFESMHEKIKKIRKDFPRAKYTNNHTGSRFTSDYDAMDKAYRALIEQSFVFVDSKTIAQTAVARAAKKHNQPYISRDIFLDDDPSASAVRRELVAAVNLAKKRGYAIAIGHPKKNTIAVIKESKNNLLKDVDVVYLKDIL